MENLFEYLGDLFQPVYDYRDDPEFDPEQEDLTEDDYWSNIGEALEDEKRDLSDD